MSARSPHDTRWPPDSRSDYEQTFDNPVREGLPTIRELARTTVLQIQLVLHRHQITSGKPTIRELALLWFSLSRLADREQENGTLVLGMR
jgi:hypothetical protein